MAKGSKETHASEIEIVPDAWSRFENAIDAVAKAPPMHRVAKKKRRVSKRVIAKKPKN
jgi:hypothetical protein